MQQSLRIHRGYSYTRRWANGSWLGGGRYFTATLLCTPGGFEGFHIEGGSPAVDDSIPVSFDPAQLEVLRALQQKYDDEHVGPPLKTRTERG